MEMQLYEREVTLVEAIRRLPPETVAELSALTERLAGLAPKGPIDWSDDDLNQFRAASLKRIETDETE